MKKIGFLEASATRTPMARTLAAAALVACALQPATAGWVESYDKKSNKKFYYDEEAAEDEDDGRHNGREHRHRTCALLLLATAARPPTVASSRLTPHSGVCPPGRVHRIWGSLGGERIL